MTSLNNICGGCRCAHAMPENDWEDRVEHEPTLIERDEALHRVDASMHANEAVMEQVREEVAALRNAPAEPLRPLRQGEMAIPPAAPQGDRDSALLHIPAASRLALAPGAEPLPIQAKPSQVSLGIKSPALERKAVSRAPPPLRHRALVLAGNCAITPRSEHYPNGGNLLFGACVSPSPFVFGAAQVPPAAGSRRPCPRAAEG